MSKNEKERVEKKEIVLNLRPALIVLCFGFGLGGVYVALKEVKSNYFLGFSDTYILEMILLLLNSLLLLYMTNKLLNISKKDDADEKDKE